MCTQPWQPDKPKGSKGTHLEEAEVWRCQSRPSQITVKETTPCNRQAPIQCCPCKHDTVTVQHCRCPVCVPASEMQHQLLALGEEKEEPSEANAYREERDVEQEGNERGHFTFAISHSLPSKDPVIPPR